MPKSKTKSAAALLSARRKRVQHVCPVCESEFRAIKKAVYCTEACRQKAKFARMKDES